MRGAQRVVLGSLAALLVLVAAATALAGRWVIPPGQEALVMRMLGGELPGGCRLLGASIDKTEVRARFACAAGEARLALRHPSEAKDAPVRSAQLAVVPDGAPPAELLDAIGARLRAEEPAWRWMAEGRAIGRSVADSGLSPRTRGLVLPLGAGAAAAFAATLAIAAMIARRLDRCGPLAPARDRRSEIAAAAITAALAFAFLQLAYPAPPVHADTTRDLLMAADCLAGHPCDHGPPTTLGVIVQGALWTRWLARCRALGLSVGATQGLLHLLHAAAAAVVYLSTRRRFGRDLAPAVAVLFTAGTAYLLDAPLLWNPSLSPLPLACFDAALVALAWDREEPGHALRGVALAAGAAFALALAIDCHVLFAVLAPALLAATAGCARRPIAATLTAALLLAITLAVDSRGAWSVNARAFADTGAALPLGGMLALAAATAGLLRSRLAQLSPPARAAVFVGAAAAYTTGATAALFAVLGPAAGHRYLAPAVPGLALAIAAIPGRIRAAAAIRAALAAAAILAAWRARGREDAGVTLGDVEAAAREIYGRAPAYRDVLARVRSRSTSTVAALAIFEPPRAAGGGDPDEDLALLLAPKSLAPPASPRVTVLDRGARALVIARVRPFLDRDRTTFCFAPRAGASDELGCADGSLPRATSGPETPEERAYPAIASVRNAFPDELLRRFGGLRQTISIAVKPFAGPAHRIALLDDTSGFRITDVRGVRFHGELPGKHVVIEGGEGSGELVLARDEEASAPRPDRYWMPSLVEVPDDDAALIKLLEDAAVR